MNHEKFLEDCVKWSQNVMKERGRFYPTWIGLTKSGEQYVITTPWQDAESKAKIINVIRLMFISSEVVEYCIMSEAWFKSFDIEKCPNESLEGQPGTKEGLMVIQGWRENEKIKISGKVFEIIREKNEFELAYHKDLEGIKGTMTEILPPRTPTPQEVLDVKRLLDMMPEGYVEFHEIQKPTMH